MNEYVPGAQAMQLVDPAALWYIPMKQTVHDEEADPGEWLPAEHSAQAELPAKEYRPAAQLIQMPETTPPTSVESVPAGPELHALAPVKPLYMPIEHEVHAAAPVKAEYRPAAQLKQMTESTPPTSVA